MMKRYARTILAIAGLMVFGAAGALNAQTTDTRTDVQFSFTVGTTTLPPDTYRVMRMPGQNGAFLIRGTRHGAVMLSQPDGRVADNSPRLVFHRYADRYFLREVRLGDNTGFSLPKTRLEIDAAEKIAGSPAPDVVVLRARPE